MPEAHLVRRPDGLFELIDKDSLLLKRVKVGDVIKVSWKMMRNGRFFRKWWLLAQAAYEIWCDIGIETHEVNGVKVMRSFKRFRKDLIVMAGFYDPVYDARGRVRLEPASISWANMPEDEFNNLYGATITVVLQQVIPQAGYDEYRLRDAVNEMVRFA